MDDTLSFPPSPDDTDRVTPIEGADVLSRIVHDHPSPLIIAQFSDGSTACYWSHETTPEMSIRAIRRRDPAATFQIYDRNRSSRYHMVGPGNDQFGEGWYCLVDLAAGPIPHDQPFYGFGPWGPPQDPRLVRAERIHWHDHHRHEVTGIDCDTGEHIDLGQVYYVLGPQEEDAAPFRTNLEARRQPGRFRTLTTW